MNKIIFLIFGIIVFMLFLSFGLMLRSAGQENLEISKIIDENIGKIKNSLSSNEWYNRFANENIRDFYPISNELYLHFDLEDVSKLSKKKFYKLDINKSDSYSLFCIKQTISNLNLKYFLVSNRKDSQIVIDTSNLSLMHFLTETLKKYKINANFKEIWI